jgi:Domain of unknown function (DUF6457)
MNAREWIERFAAELGAQPPSDDEFSAMLDLAAIAAHDSERVAAPVACWIGGASGRPLDELQAIAKQIAASEDGD